MTSRNATRAATASTTCSQLSSTSSVGPGVELLRDAAADVGTLRDGVRTPRRDRVAHAEGGTDLGDHVVGRGDADQLDEVHPRLGGLPGQHVGDPGLADAAGADDRGQPAAAHRGSQSRQVGLATEQLLCVVPDAGADGLVGREQLAMQPLQRVGRVHPEAVAQVAAVLLVAGQRHRHARDDRLRPQQGFEQLGVVARRRRTPGAGAPAPPAPARSGPGTARAAAGPRAPNDEPGRAPRRAAPRPSRRQWRSGPAPPARAARPSPDRRRRARRPPAAAAGRAAARRPPRARSRAGSRCPAAPARRPRTATAPARPAPAAPWSGWPAGPRPTPRRSGSRRRPRTATARAQPAARPAAPPGAECPARSRRRGDGGLGSRGPA